MPFSRYHSHDVVECRDASDAHADELLNVHVRLIHRRLKLKLTLVVFIFLLITDYFICVAVFVLIFGISAPHAFVSFKKTLVDWRYLLNSTRRHSRWIENMSLVPLVNEASGLKPMQ